jgi:hypothetical protein
MAPLVVRPPENTVAIAKAPTEEWLAREGLWLEEAPSSFVSAFERLTLHPVTRHLSLTHSWLLVPSEGMADRFRSAQFRTLFGCISVNAVLSTSTQSKMFLDNPLEVLREREVVFERSQISVASFLYARGFSLKVLQQLAATPLIEGGMDPGAATIKAMAIVRGFMEAGLIGRNGRVMLHLLKLETVLEWVIRHNRWVLRIGQPERVIWLPYDHPVLAGSFELSPALDHQVFAQLQPYMYLLWYTSGQLKEIYKKLRWGERRHRSADQQRVIEGKAVDRGLNAALIAQIMLRSPSCMFAEQWLKNLFVAWMLYSATDASRVARALARGFSETTRLSTVDAVAQVVSQGIFSEREEFWKSRMARM